MSGRHVNILHIRDLHYSADHSHDHDVVIQAFLTDLKSICLKEIRPDLIVFSGDLVQSGDCHISYYAVLERLISPALDIAGIKEDRIFMVPGNHDVQRSALNEVMHHGLEGTSLDRTSLNTHCIAAMAMII
jgi:3',5'-cyclic AMP phosphodiesterase CpdA